MIGSELQARGITDASSAILFLRERIHEARELIAGRMTHTDDGTKLKEFGLIMHMLTHLDQELHSTEEDTYLFAGWMVRLTSMWLFIAMGQNEDVALDGMMQTFSQMSLDNTRVSSSLKDAMASRLTTLEELKVESSRHGWAISEALNDLLVFKKPVMAPDGKTLIFPEWKKELDQLYTALTVSVDPALWFVNLTYHKLDLDGATDTMAEWVLKTHDAILEHTKDTELAIWEEFQAVSARIGPVPKRPFGGLGFGLHFPWRA
jgi:hypothetical protein